jgi:hypothetical protein
MGFNAVGPDTSKYLSFIPLDRLNKAPMISITRIPNSNGSCDSVSVSLVDMARDESAGTTLKAGVKVDPELVSAAPSPGKYASYYPQETLHEAPYISITDRGTDLTRTLTIVQAAVPTSMTAGAEILAGPPADPIAYRFFDTPSRLNKAPIVQATYVTSNWDSAVSAVSSTIPLDYAGAELILSKYRR